MARDFEQEAFAEHAKRLALKQWYQARVDAIRQSVSAYDVLARNGVSLRRHGMQQEQMSCPFHGQDTHPSARYYPETPNGPSAVWCFVCREFWDAIGLWKKFTGETKFSTVLFGLEKAFGLTPPEFHHVDLDLEDTYDPDEEDVENLLDMCEHRLIQERDRFDMLSHLKLGSLLDQIRYAVDRGEISFPVAKERLNLVKEKIGEKIRALHSQ
jgi:hypothetical protein